MEGRIEIVEKVFKLKKVFKIFKIEKVFKIIAQYFDLITIHVPVFLVAYDPTHDMPYSFVWKHGW